MNTSGDSVFWIKWKVCHFENVNWFCFLFVRFAVGAENGGFGTNLAHFDSRCARPDILAKDKLTPLSQLTIYTRVFVEFRIILL